MNQEALVSIIIPVYNGELYLAQAINSTITQSYRPIEIIVVDDGSTDSTGQIAHAFRDIRYIFQTHQGVSTARNTGLTAAQGEYIAFLDADDIWPPDKLHIQVDILQKNKHIGMSIGKIQNFIEHGIELPPHVKSDLEKNEHIGLATLVARKIIFEQVGHFNPEYEVGEDFEWMVRAKDAGIEMRILSDTLLNRRIHDSNISFRQSKISIAAGLMLLMHFIYVNRQKKGHPVKETHPLISVIIPVYNGGRYLTEAIESILAQSYRPLEVIVMDDGSTDDTSMIVKRYQSAHYFYQPNSGLSAALNQGIQHSTGPFLAFLDADDLWVENKLDLQMEAFRQNPDLDIVFGHHYRFLCGQLKNGPGQKNIETNQNLPARLKGAMLIKRDSFFRVGWFDRQWKLGEFIDWYKRATDLALNIEMLPDIVLKRRIHTDHKSLHDQHARLDYVRMMKAALDRQKRKPSDRPAMKNNKKNDSEL